MSDYEYPKYAGGYDSEDELPQHTRWKVTIHASGNGEFGEVTCDSEAEALSVKLFVEEIPSDPGPTWQYGFTMDGHSLKQEEDLTQALLSSLIHRTNTIRKRSVEHRHSLEVETKQMDMFQKMLMSEYEQGKIPTEDDIYYYGDWEEMWKLIEGESEPDHPSFSGWNAGAAQPPVLAPEPQPGHSTAAIDVDTGMTERDPDGDEGEVDSDAMDTS